MEQVNSDAPTDGIATVSHGVCQTRDQLTLIYLSAGKDALLLGS